MDSSFYTTPGRHTGILGWVLSTDHKRIGLLYLGSMFTFFYLAGMTIGLLMRLELIAPGRTIVSEHLEDLLERAGGDLEGELRYYIAEANYGKGDYQQAILDFLKVPYLVTKKGKLDWTANSLYMAGKSYEKLGNPDRAVAIYQQIVDRSGIDPTFKEAARKEIARVKSAGAKPATKP